jgi:hypothetical protein
MNVEQLIAALSKLPPTMPVFAEDGRGYFGPATVEETKIQSYPDKTMWGSYYVLADEESAWVDPVFEPGASVISGAVIGCDPDKKLSA